MQTVNGRWMWVIIPVSMASGPMSTLVTLIILTYGGNAINVAYAITLGNFLLIPASYFWGKISDRYERRSIIVLGFLLMSITLLIFPYARDVTAVSLLYGIYSFLNVSYNTPMNLLIMETAQKSKWASEFSFLSLMSSVGSLVGLVFSSVLVQLISIQQLLFGIGLLNLMATVAGVKYIPRSVVNVERVAIVHNRESFFVRFMMHPLMFLHLPSIHSFKIFKLSRLKRKPVNYVPLLYIGIVLFYIASGLFNTQYPVSLYREGESKSLVLLVISVAMLMQTVAFYIAGTLVEAYGESTTSFYSLVLRGSSYIALGLVSLSGSLDLVVLGSFTLYPLAAGIAYSIFYTASNSLIFKVVGERHQGSGLGVYSTLVGIALFSGSLLSGFVAKYGGFYIDFVLAGFLLFASAKLLKSLGGEAVSA